MKSYVQIIIYILTLFSFLWCCSSDNKHNTTVTKSQESTKLVANQIKYNEIIVTNIADALFPSDSSLRLNQLDPLGDSVIHEILPLLEIEENKDFKQFIINSLSSIDNNATSTFFKVDISGDGLEDIVYTSDYGAEENHILIWIKSDSSYYFSNFFWGNLLKFVKQNISKKYDIITQVGFSGLGYVGNVTLHKLKFKNDEFYYHSTENYKIYDKLKIRGHLIQPTRFKTINQNYRLRYSPHVINEYDTLMSEFIGDDVYGNIIAQFLPGAVGTALVKSLDKEGKTWWLVKMDIECETSHNLLYQDKNSYQVGWMSSRFLQVID